MATLFQQFKTKSTQKPSIRKNMKNITLLQRVAKKNWKKIFNQMKQKHSPQPQNYQYQNSRMYTQIAQSLLMKRKNSNQKQGKLFKQSINRQKTLQRINKNEQIFYRKKKVDSQHFCQQFLVEQLDNIIIQNPQIKVKHPKIQKKEQLQSYKILKLEKKQQNIPFMLRRRSIKTEKTMSIIQNNYNNSLKQIGLRGNLRYSLNLQDQKNLIDSMKGSKVYYRFTKQWSSCHQQTI